MTNNTIKARRDGITVRAFLLKKLMKSRMQSSRKWPRTQGERDSERLFGSLGSLLLYLLVGCPLRYIFGLTHKRGR